MPPPDRMNLPAEIQIKAIKLPPDLVEQVHTLYHDEKLSCTEAVMLISVIFFDARRRDKDALIRELKIIIPKLKEMYGNLDLTAIEHLIYQLSQN